MQQLAGHLQIIGDDILTLPSLLSLCVKYLPLHPIVRSNFVAVAPWIDLIDILSIATSLLPLPVCEVSLITSRSTT